MLHQVVLLVNYNDERQKAPHFEKFVFLTAVPVMAFKPPDPVGVAARPFVCFLIFGNPVTTFYVFLHGHA